MLGKLIRCSIVFAVAAGSAAAASGSAVAAGLAMALAAASVVLIVIYVMQRVQGASAKTTPSKPIEPREQEPQTSATPPGQGEPDEAGEPQTGWVSVSLAESIHTVSAEGDPLTLGGDLDAEVQLEIGEPPDGWDPIDPRPILVGWRLRDDNGQTWEARSVADVGLFTGPLEDDPARQSEVLFWNDAPDDWRRAIAGRCVLKGASDLLDGRDRFDMPVGSYSITIMHKYQGPQIDVGLLKASDAHATGTADCFVVRCASLYYDSVRNSDGEELAQLEDEICMSYLLPVGALLPTQAPEFHHEDLESWSEGEYGTGGTFSLI